MIFNQDVIGPDAEPGLRIEGRRRVVHVVEEGDGAVRRHTGVPEGRDGGAVRRQAAFFEDEVAVDDEATAAVRIEVAEGCPPSVGRHRGRADDAVHRLSAAEGVAGSEKGAYVAGACLSGGGSGEEGGGGCCTEENGGEATGREVLEREHVVESGSWLE